MSSERPRWRVNTQSFIGHALVHPGDEVYYTPPAPSPALPDGGHVGANLSPLNDAARDIVEAQAKDHPDKSDTAKALAIEAAKKAKDAAEAETTDGPVPKALRKGNTLTPKGGKAKGGKAAQEAEPEPGDDAEKAEDPADDDVG